VVPEDSATLLIRFAEPSPEQLYDATYHVRVIPSHIWSGRPKESWAGDTAVADLVGSGPYRVAEWRRGEYVRLVADSSAASPPAVRQAVWRFAPDPDAALNLVLSHEADLLETVGSPERAARVARDSALRLVPYPSATYGFLGFQVAGQESLVALLDRAALAGLIRASARQRDAVAGVGILDQPGAVEPVAVLAGAAVLVRAAHHVRGGGDDRVGELFGRGLDARCGGSVVVIGGSASSPWRSATGAELGLGAVLRPPPRPMDSPAASSKPSRRSSEISRQRPSTPTRRNEAGTSS